MNSVFPGSSRRCCAIDPLINPTRPESPELAHSHGFDGPRTSHALKRFGMNSQHGCRLFAVNQPLGNEWRLQRRDLRNTIEMPVSRVVWVCRSHLFLRHLLDEAVRSRTEVGQLRRGGIFQTPSMRIMYINISVHSAHIPYIGKYSEPSRSSPLILKYFEHGSRITSPYFLLFSADANSPSSTSHICAPSSSS